jgi:hypothetical protein
MNYRIQLNTIANDIINHTVLIVNKKPIQICEIEFYLHCSGHEDPFVHKDNHQSIPNKWYFHRTGNSYKSGTYKGLDITFRPYKTQYIKPQKIYGGILIRSIELPDKTFITVYFTLPILDWNIS